MFLGAEPQQADYQTEGSRKTQKGDMSVAYAVMASIFEKKKINKAKTWTTPSL